jgi:hypothetical protein
MGVWRSLPRRRAGARDSTAAARRRGAGQARRHDAGKGRPELLVHDAPILYIGNLSNHVPPIQSQQSGTAAAEPSRRGLRGSFRTYMLSQPIAAAIRTGEPRCAES